MTTITEGMTPTQFFTAVNANFSELATNWNVNVLSMRILTSTMAGDEFLLGINYNFRAAGISFGFSGGSFIGSINAHFNIAVKRFQDNFLENIIPTKSWAIEPTPLVSDDGNQIDLFYQRGYLYSTDGINYSAPQEHDIPSGYRCVSVIKEAGVYNLFGMKSDASKINLFTSANKINWTDQGIVMNVGAAGTWDDISLGTVLVWKEGATYYMLYEGKGLYKNYKIGLATSNSLAGVWNKYAGNPVLSNPRSAGAGRPVMIRDSSNNIIKYNGKYYIYYHDIDNTLGDIYRAYSVDLINWTLEGKIMVFWPLHNAPIITYGDFGIVEFKGKSYLFMNPSSQEGIAAHIDVGIDNRPLSEMLALYP